MTVQDTVTLETKTYFLSELVSCVQGSETWLELPSEEDAPRPKKRLARKGTDE